MERRRRTSGRPATACAPSPCARSARRAAAAPGTRRARARRAAPPRARRRCSRSDSSPGGSGPRGRVRAPLRRVGHAGRPGLAPATAAALTSASDSPGSFAPGQGLATRAASTKSLRSGWPSKPSGSSSGTRCGMAVEVDAEHLVGLALVPRRAGEHARRGRQPRVGRWDAGAQEQVLAAVDRPEVGDHVEAGLGVELVDGGQPVEEGAAELVAGRGQGGHPAGRRARRR